MYLLLSKLYLHISTVFLYIWVTTWGWGRKKRRLAWRTWSPKPYPEVFGVSSQSSPGPEILPQRSWEMSHARFCQEADPGGLGFLLFGLESQKKQRKGINNLFQWFLKVLFSIAKSLWKGNTDILESWTISIFPALFFAFYLPIHFPIFF